MSTYIRQLYTTLDSLNKLSLHRPKELSGQDLTHEVLTEVEKLVELVEGMSLEDFISGLTKGLQDETGYLSLAQAQKAIGAWALRNFGSNWSRTRNIHLGSLGPCLGVFEEAGELAHAVLKNAQGIRGMDDQQTYEEARDDAVADVIIYLLDFCEREGTSLEQALAKTVSKILKRDWRSDPYGHTAEAGSPSVLGNDVSEVIGEAMAKVEPNPQEVIDEAQSLASQFKGPLCSLCGGTGFIYVHEAGDSPKHVTRSCPDCGGTGQDEAQPVAVFCEAIDAPPGKVGLQVPALGEGQPAFVLGLNQDNELVAIPAITVDQSTGIDLDAEASSLQDKAQEIGLGVKEVTPEDLVDIVDEGDENVLLSVVGDKLSPGMSPEEVQQVVDQHLEKCIRDGWELS